MSILDELLSNTKLEQMRISDGDNAATRRQDILSAFRAAVTAELISPISLTFDAFDG